MRTKFTKGARCSLFQPAARPLGRLIAVMSSAIAVGCGADAGTQGAELGSTSQAATLQPIAPPAPPELKLKLNDDLAALTEVILPAVARSEGLDRIEPEDQQLFRMAKREMKNETSAGVDVLLDTAFGCHNHHPLTIELRDLVVELSIDEHTAELDVTQDGLDVDLDLDDLVITGRFWLDWPKDSKVVCALGNNYRVDVPFTVEGASIQGKAALAASGGGVRVPSLEIERLALGSVDIDRDALNFATDAVLLLGDVIASAVQELADGNVDAEPENGICGTPGAVADLDRCIEAALAEYLVPDLEKDLKALLNETLAKTLPGAQSFSLGTFSASVDPRVTSVVTTPNKDSLRVHIDAPIASSAPTAACAAGLTRATPLGATGSFQSIADADLIVPLNSVQDLAYEVARQGLLCVPLPTGSLPIALSLEPAGPITIAGGDGPIFTGPVQNGGPLPGGTTSTTSSSGGATASSSGTPIGSAVATPTGAAQSSGGQQTGARFESQPIDAGQIAESDRPFDAPARDLIITRHPTRLKASSGAVSGSLTATIELGWDLALDCAGQLSIELVTAAYTDLSGSLTAPGVSLGATTNSVKAALQAAVSALPAAVGTLPLGPSFLGLSPLSGVYVSVTELERSSTELAFGIDISKYVPTGCGSDEPSGPGYGDDTPTDDEPRIDFEPHDPRFGGAGDVGDGPDLGDTGLGSGPGQVQTGAL